MRRVLVVVIVALLAGVAASSARTANPPLSAGCARLNDPSWDGSYTRHGEGALPFNAGDRITVTAGEPTIGTPTQIFLFVGPTVTIGTPVTTAPFFASLEYVVPVAVTADIGVEVTRNTGVTFTVSCAPAAGPEQLIDQLESDIAALGLDHGIANALTSKLDEALSALAAGDTATACGALNAFLNQVAAQTGKKITGAQAADLTAAANAIRDALGC